MVVGTLPSIHKHPKRAPLSWIAWNKGPLRRTRSRCIKQGEVQASKITPKHIKKPCRGSLPFRGVSGNGTESWFKD
jgi:hypothetical protein